MKTASIAQAKNNLTSLIQQVERSEPVHLTRHGKPVAVIMSEADYQMLSAKTGKLFHAIRHWRSQLPEEFEELTDIDRLRDRTAARTFSWDE